VSPDKRSVDPPAGRRFGLQARIVLTFGLIVIGLVGVSLVYVVRNQSESLLAQTREKGFALSHSIAWLSTPSLLSYNYVALSQAATRSRGDAEVAYVVIYDKEGQIAADSRERNSFGHPPRERADLVAIQTREDRWMIAPPTLQGDAPVIEFLVPVYVEDREVKWGTVRVGISLAEVNADIQRTTHHLVLAGLVAAILCLIGARFAARAITRPIERLVVATRAVARGDYSQRLDLRSGDELETLAWHFDRMADEVQQQQAQILASREDLRRLNESLEATVESRTHALAESEAKYRILVESSPMGILIVQAGRAVFVNKAFERMTGRDASTMLGNPTDPFSVFDPESEHRIRKAVLEDAGALVEGQICQPSGKQIFVEVHTAGLLFQMDPKGTSGYLVRVSGKSGEMAFHYLLYGKRRDVKYAKIDPPALGTWHTIAVKRRGSVLRAFYDGKELLETRDDRFSKGTVGIWGEDDTLVDFADLTATAR